MSPSNSLMSTIALFFLPHVPRAAFVVQQRVRVEMVDVVEEVDTKKSLGFLLKKT